MKRKKFETAIALIITIVLLIISWQTINHFFQQEILSQQENYLQKKAELLTNQLTEDSSSSEMKVNDRTISMIEDLLSSTSERITLLNADGNILYDSWDDDLEGARNNRPEVEAVLSGNDHGSAVRRSSTLKEDLLYVALPITHNKQLTGIIRIAEPVSVFASRAENLRHWILFVLTAAFSVIGAMLLYLIRQKNRPYKTVIPVLKKIIEHPEQSRKILQASNQWEELYTTINTLSETISSTYLAYTSTENQFYLLLDDLMVGVFLIDEEENLKFANPMMREFLQLDSDDHGKNYMAFIRDSKLIQLIHQVTAEEPFVHEIITTSEPSRLVLDVSIRLTKDAHQKNQLLGTVYDLTHIRRLENVQRDFIANVSHELKTPVTSIIGFTETLLDGAKDDPDTLTEFLTIMQKDAQRLQQLIQEILLLSRGEKLTVYGPADIELNYILQRMIEHYQASIESKHLTVEINGPKPCRYLTLIEFFQPILKNLIENAVNYSYENSTVQINYSISESNLNLTIHNEGPVINETDQKRIFERFYRREKDRSRDSGGTGLGLSIVKEYTEFLNGSVEVNSTLKKGITFTLKIPASKNTIEA